MHTTTHRCPRCEADHEVDSGSLALHRVLCDDCDAFVAATECEWCGRDGDDGVIVERVTFTDRDGVHGGTPQVCADCACEAQAAGDFIEPLTYGPALPPVHVHPVVIDADIPF